ncbi:MAG: HD-GYP domain-containing protein [Lachnospiraceae bacterium]|nr:HD-GYP domain-containing protein [Lachnospiraceae bacterium]
MKIKLLYIDDLRPGMRLARDLYSNTAQLLLAENTYLDKKIIEDLKRKNVFSVYVAEGETKNERIKNSEGYRHYCEVYSHNREEISHTLSDIVNKNIPIDSTSLLDNTLEIIDNSRGSLHIFDMMYGMRDYDDSTFTHCMNVAIICNILAKWLKMRDEDVKLATLCGLLHDIGKLAIPEELIKKPGKLTDEEYAIVKSHAQLGYDILKSQNINPYIKEAALMHHERYDGTGYPQGLKGDEISIFARIVAIADVYEAMTADRVYREGICPFDVIEKLEKETYGKYDTYFMSVFLENIMNSHISDTVLLSDGRVGEVVLINKNYLSKPLVKCENEFVDLQKTKGKIVIEKVC